MFSLVAADGSLYVNVNIILPFFLSIFCHNNDSAYEHCLPIHLPRLVVSLIFLFFSDPMVGSTLPTVLTHHRKVLVFRLTGIWIEIRYYLVII